MPVSCTNQLFAPLSGWFIFLKVHDCCSKFYMQLISSDISYGKQLRIINIKLLKKEKVGLLSSLTITSDRCFCQHGLERIKISFQLHKSQGEQIGHPQGLMWRCASVQVLAMSPFKMFSLVAIELFHNPAAWFQSCHIVHAVSPNQHPFLLFFNGDSTPFFITLSFFSFSFFIDFLILNCVNFFV